ncbi:MAG: FHA domain-containing protein [Kineosporiaceae bacterium]|nr:FHA domain-containing protein [Kineosporiaceae bacterium]
MLLSVDGATTTAPTPVLVGRSNNSPLAKALARYEFISRQHLVLERRGEVVTVVDVSKLGTAWGDGRRLAPSERHEASLPLLLRLAHECTLYVEAHEHPAEGTA